MCSNKKHFIVKRQATKKIKTAKQRTHLHFKLVLLHEKSKQYAATK